MKCPKCGFNSFEFLDHCKKCNTSLAPFKNNLGIRAVVLPPSHNSSSGTGTESGPEGINSGEASPVEEFSWENPPENNSVEIMNSGADFEMDLSDLQEGSPAPPLYPESSVHSAEADNVPDLRSPGETDVDMNYPLASADSPGKESFEDLLELTEPEDDWNGHATPVELEKGPDPGIDEQLFESFRIENPPPASYPPALPSLEEIFPTDAADAAPDMTIPQGKGEKDPILDDLESLFELNDPGKRQG